ncbi:MAG: hypothetical protein HZB55_11705 [Deltaproteobacteria bacterium]|nr:hypothetical protein [Deltaproteobacteria bacterium]
MDVLALGRACVDEILEVGSYPAEDTKVPLAARLREGGGQASTAACLVASLGGEAGFVGVLGDDAEGRFARERLTVFGVSVAGPTRGRTPVAYCVVSRAGGTRTILYERSAAEPLRFEEVPAELLGRARTVLVDPQAEPLIAALAPACRASGALLVADAEHAPDGWEETWGRVDVLAVSETFLREAVPGAGPEEALIAISRKARGMMCLATLGERGAIALLDGRLLRVPAIPVAVRDTTGAGDAFHGALCLALARGLGWPDVLRFAVAAASLSCRGLGGRSFPAAAEVEAVWRTLPSPD